MHWGPQAGAARGAGVGAAVGDLPSAETVKASDSPEAALFGTSGTSLIFQVAELGNGVFERINTRKRSESGAARGP